MNERNETKPLQVGDVVIGPGLPGSRDYKEFEGHVSYVNEKRNWCRISNRGLQRGEGKIALTLTRANELERVGK